MIKKFKTIEEASEQIYHHKLDKDYLDKINSFFQLIEKLNHFKVVAGIQKIKEPFAYKTKCNSSNDELL